MRIAILGAAERGSNVLIKNEILKRGIEYVFLDPTQLGLRISDSENGHDGLYNAITGARINKSGIHAVICRLGGTGQKGVTIARQLKIMGVPLTHEPAAIQVAADKLHTHQVLSLYRGIKNPVTYQLNNLDNWQTFIDKVGFPCFLKRSKGSQGNEVYALRNQDQADTLFRAFKSRGMATENTLNPFFIQKMIDTREGGQVSDYRVFIVDGKIEATMRRISPNGSLLANISQGATGQSVKLSDEHEAIALRAAEAVGLKYSISGVDLLITDSGVCYVCEINSNPGTKISLYTGVNVVAKMVDFAVNIANGKNTSMYGLPFVIHSMTMQNVSMSFTNQENQKITNSLPNKENQQPKKNGPYYTDGPFFPRHEWDINR